jgi:hypothetical protein
VKPVLLNIYKADRRGRFKHAFCGEGDFRLPREEPELLPPEGITLVPAPVFQLTHMKRGAWRR